MNNFTVEQYTNRSASHADYKSVQAWKKPKPAAAVEISDTSTHNSIINNLEKANVGKVGHFDVELKTASAYAPQNTPESTPQHQFKFGDIVDIVNPLQHIPIVNMAYRSLTKDDIHPISQIVGGAVYGGPIGAVTGTANAITKMKTGLDIGDHAMKMAGLGTPATANTPPSQKTLITTQIENAKFINQVPNMAIGFAQDLVEPRAAIGQYEKAQITQERTAGKSIFQKVFTPYGAADHSNNINFDINNLPSRENVTSMTLSDMPRDRLI